MDIDFTAHALARMAERGVIVERAAPTRVITVIVTSRIDGYRGQS